MPRFAIFLLVAIGFATLAACAHPGSAPAVPRADTVRAQPLGIANARFFADGDPSLMIQEGRRALEREHATLRAEGRPTTPAAAGLLSSRCRAAATTARSAPAC